MRFCVCLRAFPCDRVRALAAIKDLNPESDNTRRFISPSAVSFKQGLNLLAGSFVLASHLNSFQSPSVGVCNFAVAERPPFFKRALRSTGAEDDQRRPVLCVYSRPYFEIQSTHSPYLRS